MNRTVELEIGEYTSQDLQDMDIHVTDEVLTTQEARKYLRISRPTLLKYFYAGKIKAAKAGKGWRVLKSELNNYLRGE